jgi:hypothetical protein
MVIGAGMGIVFGTLLGAAAPFALILGAAAGLLVDAALAARGGSR